MSKSLAGIGASPGRAQGKARWILSPKDIEEFQVGDIILAKMTSPDWGEVFQKAAAVATEQGGMLCHAAIVAREEGIPAVVGLGEDLASIRSGTIVAVDGDEGTLEQIGGIKMAKLDILYEGYVREGKGTEIVRNTVCLVQDEGVKLLVDPGLVESPRLLEEALKQQGLKKEDITHVYVTHYHMDHLRLLGLFPHATAIDSKYIYSGESWRDHDGDGYEITPNIKIMHTPGHTMDDSALLVKTDQGTIAISHVWWFPDRTPVEDPMAVDQKLLNTSRKKVEASADWIVTPHGGMMRVKSKP